MSFQQNITGAVNSMANATIAGSFAQDKKMAQKYGPTGKIASQIMEKNKPYWGMMSADARQLALEHMNDRLEFMKQEAMLTDKLQKRASTLEEAKNIRAEGLKRKEQNIHNTAVEMLKLGTKYDDMNKREAKNNGK